jgi:hypothetical protein
MGTWGRRCCFSAAASYESKSTFGADPCAKLTANRLECFRSWNFQMDKQMHFVRKYIEAYAIANVCNGEIFPPLHTEHRILEPLM